MTPLGYAQRSPSPALAPYIECVWMLRGDPEAAAANDDPGASPERVLPDGRIEIVVNCGGPVRQTRDGAVVTQPAELLVGPTTRAVLIRPTGPIDMVGIRLRHGAAVGVLGVPAQELTDAMHPLRDVADFPRSLREQLADAAGFDERVAIVERHLLSRIASARRSAHRSTAVAVSRILRSDGAIDVATVAGDAGVSVRQLARRFARDVGVGPKLLARLARFHALLRVVEFERPRTLASAAARAGYADQSHLVRDFREFAGLTPSRYFRGSHQLTAYFLDLEPTAIRPGT